jgi:hypothetical protein
MKHLLNGVAMAAVMALAMPAFAQNAPMTPSTPPKASPAPAPATTQTQTPAPAPNAPAPTMAAKPMHHMAMHHRYRGVGEADRMTEQLNQQELQRIQSGAPPSTPMPAAMPSNYQTPGKSDMPPMAAPPPPAR